MFSYALKRKILQAFEKKKWQLQHECCSGGSFSKTEQRFMIKRQRNKEHKKKKIIFYCRLALARVLFREEFIYKNHMIKKY